MEENIDRLYYAIKAVPVEIIDFVTEIFKYEPIIVKKMNYDQVFNIDSYLDINTGKVYLFQDELEKEGYDYFNKTRLVYLEKLKDYEKNNILDKELKEKIKNLKLTK